MIIRKYFSRKFFYLFFLLQEKLQNFYKTHTHVLTRQNKREKKISLPLPPPNLQNPSFTAALLLIPVTGSSPAPVATPVPSVF